jgi:RIP metalloprotease RseP
VNGNSLNTTTDLVESVSIETGNSIEIGIMRSDTVSGLSLTPDLMTFETVELVPRVSPPKLLVVEVVTDTSKEVDLYEARMYNSSLNLGDTMTQGAIGVMIGMTNMKFATVSDPIWRALPNSVNTIWNVLVITFSSLRQGVESGTNPGILGPVGIAQVAGEGVNKLGLSWVFQFTAFLSISLAIVNVLPLPPLDGGRLVFVILEMVRGGKRISSKMEGMVHLIGFIAVVGLIVFVSFFEIQQVLEGEKLFLR